MVEDGPVSWEEDGAHSGGGGGDGERGRGMKGLGGLKGWHLHDGELE